MTDNKRTEPEWSAEQCQAFVKETAQATVESIVAKIQQVPLKQQVLLYGRIINAIWAGFYSPILFSDNDRMLEYKVKRHEGQGIS